MKMSWGINPTSVNWYDKWAKFKAEKVTCWWGARAIFHGGAQFELVHDRNGFNGGSDAEQKALENWINSNGFKAVEDARLEVDGHYIVVSPKGSFGYLYIGIWKVPDVDFPQDF
jgi:hypothetical protein